VAESEHPPPHRPADPEPALDPEVDARVRALLADRTETGPMPREVSERISRALADESRLRVGRGPLTGAGDEPVRDMAGPDGSGGGVVALPRRRQPRPWVAVAAVAAAAAVVAVGASALHVTKRPNPAAVVVGDTGTARATTTPTAPTSTGAPSAPHIQLSTTDYDASTLAAKARALLDDPAAPLHELAAESPALGPIATPVGLASCLDALAVGPGEVSADLATFEGRPAAIIVVTQAGTSTAYAVERSCSPGNVTALAGATPVP
jgi:hypothetical protein